MEGDQSLNGSNIYIMAHEARESVVNETLVVQRMSSSGMEVIDYLSTQVDSKLHISHIGSVSAREGFHRGHYRPPGARNKWKQNIRFQYLERDVYGNKFTRNETLLLDKSWIGQPMTGQNHVTENMWDAISTKYAEFCMSNSAGYLLLKWQKL